MSACVGLRTTILAGELLIKNCLMAWKAYVDDLKERACTCLECVCVCVDWGEGRSSRCAVGKLPFGTKTQELPLTAKINQNPGNLFMKRIQRQWESKISPPTWKNATYGKAHTSFLTIEIHINRLCCSCDLSWSVSSWRVNDEFGLC